MTYQMILRWALGGGQESVEGFTLPIAQPTSHRCLRCSMDWRTPPRSEDFDVNNICVIVPPRSSQAQILLELTIGRDLCLMWRGQDFEDIKRDNRERIHAGQQPGSLLGVLSIVKHPAFQSFYDEPIKEGLVGSTGTMKTTMVLATPACACAT